jgi:hypothetical protein
LDYFLRLANCHHGVSRLSCMMASTVRNKGTTTRYKKYPRVKSQQVEGRETDGGKQFACCVHEPTIARHSRRISLYSECSVRELRALERIQE